MFGLNTLGGALNVTTRDGFDEDGGQVRAWGGLWGRKAVDAEAGGHDAHVSYFVTGDATRERGWAEHDPSRLAQFFGKLGWRDGADRADVSLSTADTRRGRQPDAAAVGLSDPRQAYSWPDYQTNKLVFVNANASHRFSPGLPAGGQRLRPLAAQRRPQQQRQRRLRPARGQSAPGNQPTGNAINDVRQSRAGVSLQLTSTAPLAGRANHLSGGASFRERLHALHAGQPGGRRVARHRLHAAGLAGHLAARARRGHRSLRHRHHGRRRRHLPRRGRSLEPRHGRPLRPAGHRD